MVLLRVRVSRSWNLCVMVYSSMTLEGLSSFTQALAFYSPPRTVPPRRLFPARPRADFHPGWAVHADTGSGRVYVDQTEWTNRNTQVQTLHHVAGQAEARRCVLIGPAVSHYRYRYRST